MGEDASKESDSFGRFLAKLELPVHNIKLSPNSHFGRLLKKINRFFKRESSQPPDNKLNGRIYQLKGDISKVIENLTRVREELQKETDPHFISLVNTIIDPLIKEVNRLQKIQDPSQSIAQQVRTSTGYSDWIEKAKMWIELCSKRHQQKQAICHAVVEHVLQEFHSSIDRDLQVIQDYLNHTVDGIEIDDYLKNNLKDRLEPQLSQHLFELYLLKNHPDDLSIDSLQFWRAQADLSREDYFTAALHTIDHFASEALPNRVIEETIDDHEIEIRMNLMSLEERIIELESNLTYFDHSSFIDDKMMYISQLIDLESDANKLNGNLHLSHGYFERVQTALEDLSKCRKILQ